MSTEKDLEAGRPAVHGDSLAPEDVPHSGNHRVASHQSGISQMHDIVRSLSNTDAEIRYKEEEADRGLPVDHPSDSNEGSPEEPTIISWEPNDPENPHNWSTTKKTLILIITMFLIVNSTMGSSLPSEAIPFITAEFDVTSQTQKVLPMSCYLIGYVLGPLVWGPLSEYFGRRIVSVGTFIMFVIWTMGCALAPTWTGLLFFRLLCGAFASAPIAVVAGILADMYANPVTRGRAFAWFMATTVWGPLIAPIISGFCSTSIGWRWTFWIGLIYAVVTGIPLFFMPETYGPVLLSRRAAKIRKTTKAEVYAAAELESKDLGQLVARVLTRPLRMIAFELIVSSTCLYLALCYSIFYMSFEAFPIIFQQLYGLSPGQTGLAFLPIGVGALLSMPIFYAFDHILAWGKKREAKWTKKEESRRLPIACVGGPMFVISLFWLGWTAREDIHFAVPMIAGIPFGAGFMLIFMALLNYLTDAYEIFAASANAAASAARSLCAVVLPLAATPMFDRLGIAGGCSLLGGLSALMCIIPFVFIWQGENIRAGSKFCIALKERREEMERKAEEQARRQAEAARKNAGAVKEETV